MLAELEILFQTSFTNRIFRQISPGEVDSVGSEDWNYGYVLGSTFTIFSTDNLVLKQNDQVVTLSVNKFLTNSDKWLQFHESKEDLPQINQ